MVTGCIYMYAGTLIIAVHLLERLLQLQPLLLCARLIFEQLATVEQICEGYEVKAFAHTARAPLQRGETLEVTKLALIKDLTACTRYMIKSMPSYTTFYTHCHISQESIRGSGVVIGNIALVCTVIIVLFSLYYSTHCLCQC
jgi:hypothetical protein